MPELHHRLNLKTRHQQLTNLVHSGRFGFFGARARRRAAFLKNCITTDYPEWRDVVKRGGAVIMIDALWKFRRDPEAAMVFIPIARTPSVFKILPLLPL